MTDPETVADALRRNTIVVGSRLSALTIYGVIGITVGLAMMTSGTAVTIEQHWGTPARFWLGIPAMIGGAHLLVSGIIGQQTLRGWVAGLIGTSFMGIWSVMFTVGYVIGALERGVVLLSPGEPIPPDTSLPYVFFLYQGLALLILLHLVTLARLGRPRR